jgi:putative PEP-CTERM system TPR-repeat lipoprotein
MRHPSRQACRLTAIALALALALPACSRMQDKQQLMREARQYQAKGEFKSAVIQLKNILQQDPADASARFQLGTVYLDTGDMPSAEKELKRSLELGLAPGMIWPYLGKAMLAQGLYQGLLDQLAANPSHPDTEVLRASAEAGLTHLDKARDLLQAALAHYPNHAGVLLGLARLDIANGKLDDAAALVKRALSANPSDIDSQRMMAELLRVQGLNEQAQHLYEAVLVQRPGHVATMLDLASLHIQAGRYTEARARLAAARKLLPNSLLLVYTQALLDFREGHPKAAQEQLQLLLRAAPEHMPSNLLMGAVQSRLGSLSQAESYLRKFLEAYPGHIYASKLLATVLLKSGDAAQAEQLLLPLLASHQDDADLIGLLGEASMAQDRFADAEGYFKQASGLAPQAPVLHAALAVSRLQQGEDQHALADLEQATELDSQSSRSGVLLVLTQLRNHKHAEALRTVQQLESRQGRNPLLLNLQGGVQLVSGDRKAARSSFEQALSMDPQYFSALDNLTQIDLFDKQPEIARKRLEAALARAPKNPQLMAALAKLALIRGDENSAQAWLERAAHENPDALPPSLDLLDLLLRRRKSEKALLLARQLEASHPGEPSVLTLLADAQSQAGDQHAALESLEKLATAQPQSAETQYRIATVQVALKDRDAMRSALNKALALRPDYPQAQVLLIQSQLLDGAQADAMRVARQVQQQHPDSPLGLKLEGDILMAGKQAAKAVDAYQRAFEAQAAATQLMPLHRALRLAGQNQLAEQRMQQWLTAHPDDLQVRLYYGGSLLEQKDYASASSQFEAILKSKPDDLAALNNLAWSLQQSGDKRALSKAVRAFQLAPHNTAVMDTLGWILAERGEWPRALRLLQSASAQPDASDDVRFHYGAALARSGDKAAARVQLQAVLDKRRYARQDEVRALLRQL